MQALLPILALDAVARGLHSWRSREKRCRAEYRLPPHSKTLPPGRRASGRRASHFGVRWQAVFRATPLSGGSEREKSCRRDGGLRDAAPAILECGGKRYSARHRSQEVRRGKNAAAGTEGFGTPRQPFWSAVASGIPRDTALRSKKTEPKLKKCLKIRCVCPAAHAHDQGMYSLVTVYDHMQGQSKITITIMITNQRPHQNCHAP